MALTFEAAAGAATEPLAAERQWFEERGVNFGLVEGDTVVQRPIPFDPIPRKIPRVEWAQLERGLLQRVAALDQFVRDIYDGQRILRAGRIPAAVVYSSPAFLRYASGPPAQVPGQDCVAGIDLRGVNGQWLVLEDNLRVPSGMASALAARAAMLDLHRLDTLEFDPRSLADYSRRLRSALRRRGPDEGLVGGLAP